MISRQFCTSFDTNVQHWLEWKKSTGSIQISVSAIDTTSSLHQVYLCTSLCWKNVLVIMGVVWKKEVWERPSHNKRKEDCPNSSNKVSIRLREFSHWIFLFQCRLLTNNANLRVASTSVRPQPCFNVTVRIPHLQVTLLVQKGVGTPFPPHYTHAHDPHCVVAAQSQQEHGRGAGRTRLPLDFKIQFFQYLISWNMCFV